MYLVKNGCIRKNSDNILDQANLCQRKTILNLFLTLLYTELSFLMLVEDTAGTDQGNSL